MLFYLVLFLILLTVLSGFTFSANNAISGIIYYFCTLFLITSFFSGWGYLIKEITSKEEEKIEYIKTFLEGVGKNTISLTIGVIFLFIIMNLVMYLSNYIALKYFGDISFIQKDLTVISQDPQTIKNYILNLSQDKIITIYGWALCGAISLFFYGFLVLFYLPSLIYNEKNNFFTKPFVAIINSLIFVFKNFKHTILIYLGVLALYIFLLFANTATMQNPILSFIVLFIYIYFISFVIMLIFNYYEQRYNSSNGNDSIGQDKCLDTTSEEN